MSASARSALAMLASVLVALAAPAHAQSAADSAGIRAAALDYIEGWYAGDGARMERALHPELAKRNVTTDSASGRSRLSQLGALTMVLSTRAGGGTRIPAGERKSEVQILDIYRGAASARVRAASWIDYLHLARYNGRWVIVNVLWEYDAGSCSASASPPAGCAAR
ncbi:MAG: nuclear transport factor 2 family protein [bacterium]